MTGPGERAIDATLVESTLTGYALLREAVSRCGQAKQALDKADSDIMLRLAAANELSLCAAEVGELAKALHKRADEAMVAAMLEAGCPGFIDHERSVSLHKKPDTVDIPDESAVPAEYQNPPTPDKRKALKALKNGTALNWATVKPGAGYSLSRRSIT